MATPHTDPGAAVRAPAHATTDARMEAAEPSASSGTRVRVPETTTGRATSTIALATWVPPISRAGTALNVTSKTVQRTSAACSL
jgi:hypothetical protein